MRKLMNSIYTMVLSSCFLILGCDYSAANVGYHQEKDNTQSAEQNDPVLFQSKKQPEPGLRRQWNGSYTGTNYGKTARVTLMIKGDRIQGQIQEEGRQFTLRGKVDPDKKIARGTLHEVGQTSPIAFSLKLKGDKLEMGLSLIHPKTRKRVKWSFSFIRERQVAKENRRRKDADDQDHDHRLFGLWRHTDIEIDQYSSRVRDSFLTFYKNGFVKHRVGRGVAGVRGSTFHDTEGETSQAKWRIKGKYIQLQSPKTTKWVKFGPYILSGDKMLLVSMRGDREIWYRIKR